MEVFHLAIDFGRKVYFGVFTSVKLQNLFGKIIINNIEVALWYIEDGSN